MNIDFRGEKEKIMIETLTEIIREYIGNDTICITENTAFIAELGLNSLDLVNLACKIEDKFDIEIPDRAIKELKTVLDVINFIKKQ